MVEKAWRLFLYLLGAVPAEEANYWRWYALYDLEHHKEVWIEWREDYQGGRVWARLRIGGWAGEWYGKPEDRDPEIVYFWMVKINRAPDGLKIRRDYAG